ncbi:MAG: exodeoxyribonuclease VII small subunit [Acutalibacteraceae bacterium]
MASVTFEQAMTRLEQIVAALESGRCTLDESMKLFEEGAKLTAFCQKALRSAEQKIVKLTAAENGEETELTVPQDTQLSMGEALSD